MRTLRIIQTTAIQWGVQLPLRPLLRTSSSHCTSKQAHGQGHVGSHRTFPESPSTARHPQPSGIEHDAVEMMEAACS